MLKSIFIKSTSIASVCLLALALTLSLTKPVQAAYPGGDCDNNAVIYCGVNSVNEIKQKYAENQAGNVQDIYRYFGMSSAAAFDGMVEGSVTKNGDIYVGNEKVGEGAVTGGRKFMNGSTKLPNIDAYTRPPSVSFLQDSLAAFVKVDGSYVKAILKVCGNPVIAKAIPKPQPQPTPTPKPTPETKSKVLISKDVSTLSSEGWSPWNSEEGQVEPGSSVRFRITVKSYAPVGSTNIVAAKNVKIHDSLPSGLSVDMDELLEISPATGEFTISDLVGEGITIEEIAPGKSIEIIFKAQVEDDTEACDAPLLNTARASAEGAPEVKNQAKVKVVCQEEEEVLSASTEETPPSNPQVKGAQTETPNTLPVTGPAGVVGIFSATSALGFAAYKLKEFYLIFLK